MLTRAASAREKGRANLVLKQDNVEGKDISKIEKQLEEIDNEIKKVEKEIDVASKNTEKALEEYKKTPNPDLFKIFEFFSREKEQLRGKEEQLRSEKEQLRERLSLFETQLLKGLRNLPSYKQDWSLEESIVEVLIKQFGSSSGPSRIQQEDYCDVSSTPTNILESRLRSVNLCLYDLGGEEGACLFNVLSDAFFGDISYHIELRNKICDYIGKHPKKYGDFFTVKGGMNRYIAEMRNVTTWGTNLELAVASNLYSVRIVILQSRKEPPLIEICPDNGQYSKSCAIAFLAELHYYAIRKLEGVNLRSMGDPVEWITELAKRKAKNKEMNENMNHLNRLAAGYILDIDLYLEENLLFHAIEKYFSIKNEQASKFVELQEDAKVPNLDESNDSIKSLWKQINNWDLSANDLTKENRSLMYWLPLLSLRYSIPNYLSILPKSEMLLTGSVICELIDMFWTRYSVAKLNQNFFTLEWQRGTDIRYACKALPDNWKVSCDGYVVLKININDSIPLLMFIEEDKAIDSQRDEDRCRIAEISRYAHDTIRNQCPFLDSSQLENIIIPAVHIAGTYVDYYNTQWMLEPEHFYLFQKVCGYQISKGKQLEEAAQRLWNVLDIIIRNAEIIYDAFKNNPVRRHRYPMRPHNENPPTTASKSTQQAGGSDDNQTNTPIKKGGISQHKAEYMLSKLGFEVKRKLSHSCRSIVFETSRFGMRSGKRIVKMSRSAREAEILGRFGGKAHIINAISIKEIDDGWWILELPFLSDVKIASVTELQKFMWQLMEAAEFLHRNEICYRDFKRSNVRFNGHSVFLVDFDCAISFKQLESYLEAKREFPRVGTKGYMAPEVEAGQAYGSSADIWSLGILFAEELMRLTDNFFEVNAITQSPIDEVLRICAKRFGEKSDAFDLISHMIVEVPTERLTAEQILSHRYFQNILQDLKKHQHRFVQTDPVIEGYYYIFPPESMSYFEATLEQSNQFVPNKKRHQLIY